jgi:hypothetical protein
LKSIGSSGGKQPTPIENTFAFRPLGFRYVILRIGAVELSR